MTETQGTVFLSYAHPDRPLADGLAAGLRRRGFRVWIDQGELGIGHSLVDRISEALDQVDFVAVIVSPASVESNWCQKELSLAMTGEIDRRTVSVLPLRIDNTPMPPAIKDKLYLDIERHNVPAAVDRLVDDIRRHLNPPSTLPPRTPRVAPSASAPQAEVSMPVDSSTPVKLTGIDIDNVTAPRADGTRGSGLYSVPFTLSQTPDRTWGELLVQNWNHPPRFTTMHRPGIARVVGDRIVLDGTTIDEVAQTHHTTLALAVSATNDQHRLLVEQARGHQVAARLADEDGRRRVQETARGLTFG